MEPEVLGDYIVTSPAAFDASAIAKYIQQTADYIGSESIGSLSTSEFDAVAQQEIHSNTPNGFISTHLNTLCYLLLQI